jgi:hypothetical protein
MPAEKVRPVRLHLSSQRPDLTIGALPGTDKELARAAVEIVELGAWLLAACNAPLLCVALTPVERAGEHWLTPWDGATGPDVKLARNLCSSSSPYRTLVAKLDRAAAELFALLQDRWPAYAQPPRLGVVTDGTGIGFSPDDPWPLRAGWLSHQILAQTQFTPILPFDARGSWSTLTAHSPQS